MTEAEKEAREALIEQVAKALEDDGWLGHPDELVTADLRMIAEVAVVVFEQASRAPQPTEDERRIPGFAERERGAQAAWEFFARDDRDVSRDFRAGYHQGTIDEARRRAPQPTDDEREALANLIPLGFTERDPVRNVYEAADRILAAGFRRGAPAATGPSGLESPDQDQPDRSE